MLICYIFDHRFIIDETRENYCTIFTFKFKYSKIKRKLVNTLYLQEFFIQFLFLITFLSFCFSFIRNSAFAN